MFAVLSKGLVVGSMMMIDKFKRIDPVPLFS